MVAGSIRGAWQCARVWKSVADSNRFRGRKGRQLKFTIYTIWGLAIVLALVAGWIDWRSRRLPNWLTVSGFAVGIVVNTAFFGWAGAKTAFLGAGIALAILLPVVLLRGLGAGDWKLMGALGAIVGKDESLHVLIVTIFVAGLIAIGQMIWQKRVRVTLRNLWELVRGFFVFGLKPHPDINLDNAGASTLPFGVAAAAATLLCWGAVIAGI
jgi:prepilin peptidase CpaA